MTQPMDDLLLPPHENVAYKGDEPVYFYTADQLRDYAKKAVEAERAKQKPLTYEPSFEQLKQIFRGLDRCLSRDSKFEFLRVWIRDWTTHKLTAPPARPTLD